MPRLGWSLNLRLVVPDPVATPPKRRHLGWWILLGGVAGIALCAGLLLLPPVQAWLLQRMLATQPGSGVEFTRVSVGPRGADATDVKLRLPNLTVEARALRLAISPWQLLSRRRLAIADLQARQLAIRATTASDSAAAPFTGLLDGMQAPLAWACSKAEADGTLTLEQPGTAPIVATFALKGADLDITKPGRVELEFTTPGELVAGFDGTWKFTGTLDFAATADEHIDRVVIDGRISPAAHPQLKLPGLHLRLTAARTPGGESYELEFAPATGESTAKFTGRATFERANGHVSGTWEARGGSALVAQIWQRADLPVVETDTHGAFALDAWAGAVQASAEGEFSGTEWQRYLPELAAVGRLHGHHAISLERSNGRWLLKKLAATARSDGSAAAFELSLTRPIALPPGGDGNITPWGQLSVKQVPLGWMAPVLGLAHIAGGEIAGRWSVASPDAGTLRFLPLDLLSSTAFTVTDPVLPKLPQLTLQAETRLDLTAASALVHVDQAALVSEKGDRIEGRIESQVDLDKLIADTDARWQARLPTWLGTQGPALHGEFTADVTENFATVRTFQVTARQDNEERTAFRLEALAPFKVDYENDTTVLTAEGDIARITAQNLRLDWAAALLPGLSLTGELAEGESTLRRTGRGFTIVPGRPWLLQNLQLVQGGVPLLHAPRFTLVPAGRVELDANWVPQDFAGTLKLGGSFAEIFRLRDPAGPFSATGAASLTRIAGRIELRSFDFAVAKADQSPLLTLEMLHPVVLGTTAKTNDIDKAADTLRLRTTALPLEWLQPLLPAGLQIAGTLEPAEFAAKIDLPNAFLNPARPLVFNIARLDDATAGLLRDARIELSPSVILMGQLAALVVENGRVVLGGHPAGNAGLSLMYFTNNLQIPISASVDLSTDVGLLRGQPVAATLPLPVTGQARFLYSQDLSAGKRPSATFLLSEVPSPDGHGMLPRLGARLTMLDKTAGQPDRIKLEFQYQTAPVWSTFTTEFDYGMNRDKAEINATLQGEFFDAGRFMDLLNTCVPTVAPPVAPREKPGAAATSTPPVPTAAFWHTLAGIFRLDFGAIVHAPYRVEKLTGEFEINDEALHLRRLAGRMFDGGWSGHLRLDFDPEQTTAPYGLTGGFDITDFSAQNIVQAAYPNELGSFAGRLNFSSRVSSRGTGLSSLLADSTSEFRFHSSGGRLQLKVPHASLASAALLVGGAITFSPELRAIGRLVKQFSDLPVDELSARGRRLPGGAIFLDDLRLHTPQLRLSARGEVPPQPGIELAARTFALPVSLSARDELAVILKGMKLLGKKPDADGFFPMTRQPLLRGTLGAPDTTDLYDVFAQAVSGSSGTFGFLMKKVQQEVEKSRATPAPR